MLESTNQWVELWQKKKKNKAPMGFEPMTSCLLDRRSNQLSYGAFDCNDQSDILQRLMLDQTCKLL